MIYENKYNRIKETWHGSMLYNKNDIFIGKCLDLYGEWCAQELEDTIKYCNGVVLDVGANIGTHTLVYAKHAKRVFAFEPQPTIFNMLCANVTINCLENVWTARTAIGNSIGIEQIPCIDFSKPGNFGGSVIGSGNNTCYIRTIDEYIFKDVSLIKIDVEGKEGDVLLGAKRTIEKYKPVLYIENDREEKDELCRLVESLGYEWQWHYSPLFREDNYLQSKENVFPCIFGINMLCTPKR